MNRLTYKILAISILFSLISISNADEHASKGNIALIKDIFIDIDGNMISEESEADKYLYRSLNDNYKNRIINFDKTRAVLSEYGIGGKNGDWFFQFGCIGCPEVKYPFSDVSKSNNWEYLIAIPSNGGGQFIITGESLTVNDVYTEFYRISYLSSLMLIKADTGDILIHKRINKVSEGSVAYKDWKTRESEEKKRLVTDAIDELLLEFKSILHKS